MTDLPAFDEVHVVSDLHMGGREGFQILRETARLAGFVRRLATQRPDGRVALVLNGDVFDTLAEDTGGYIAVDDAEATVRRIVDDPSFAPIWLAFAAFARLPGRTLVFVIGNHDIEIALPPVQRFLLSRLAGDDLQARARIEFSTAGAGHACTVGGSRVFCIHGNEVDGWNYNRYEDLARLGRRLNAGASFDPSEWRPNAGTRLVKDVMNDIKRAYAWIDLLKPETAAALGTLLVLDPAQAWKIGPIAGIVNERRTGDAQVEARLSADGPSRAAETPNGRGAMPAKTLDQLLGPHMRSAMSSNALAEGSSPGVHGPDDARDMLLAAEASLSKPTGLRAPQDQTLGVPQLIWDRLRGIDKPEALRRALLDWLHDDKSFDVDDRDFTYQKVSAAVGPAVDFIVTGHTHLERAIDMGHGQCYFNSGTWIRLLRFGKAMLADTASFRKVYDVLIDGRMKAIDAASFGGQPFVLDQTSAVSIRERDGRAVGDLVHVTGDGSGEPVVVKSITARN